MVPFVMKMYFVFSISSLHSSDTLPLYHTHSDIVKFEQVHFESESCWVSIDPDLMPHFTSVNMSDRP